MLPARPGRQHLTTLIQRPTSRLYSQHPQKSKVIFSGIQPTGVPHLGNYLGALKQWVKLQDEAEPDTKLMFSLVDWHAITIKQDAKQLKQWKKESLATLMAIGLDPNRSILFHQSDVPQHAELMWILSCSAPVGYLSRMTSWKSKIRVNQDSKVEDTALQLGLLSYPVLQAADVLVHRATHVPVGEDQAQHLEFTRSCAGGFNHLYGHVFPIPETVISPARRIKSLQKPTQKMSKSDVNAKARISITDSKDEIFSKIKAAVTDSEDGVSYDPERRPAIANLINVARYVGNESFTPEEFIADCGSKKAFKDKLASFVEENISPIRDRYQSIVGTIDLQQVAERGAEKARQSAEETMKLVREAVGLK